MTLKSKPVAKRTPVAAIVATPTHKPLVVIPSFDALPDSAFIREAQLVQSPKRPGVPVPLPFSAPTLWRLSKIGAFPAPIKLGAKITAWKVGEVRAWLNAQSLGVS